MSLLVKSHEFSSQLALLFFKTLNDSRYRRQNTHAVLVTRTPCVDSQDGRRRAPTRGSNFQPPRELPPPGLLLVESSLPPIDLLRVWKFASMQRKSNPKMGSRGKKRKQRGVDVGLIYTLSTHQPHSKQACWITGWVRAIISLIGGDFDSLVEDEEEEDEGPRAS